MDKKFKKVFSSIKARAEGVTGSGGGGGGGSSGRAPKASAPITVDGVTAGDETPEGQLLAAVQAFCETGGPGNPNPGEEFLHLPTIVDIAESVPSAAAIAAHAIRKNLDVKHSARPYIHYNSIMLLRILSQNPGHTFTRNLGDQKTIHAVKDLLRNGRDPSVWQILCETLDHFTTDPARIADEGLNPLREMWKKERPQHRGSSAPPPLQIASTPQPAPGLPSPSELMARVSEANTSAALLLQLVQSTPASELQGHDLIREFADRCKLAMKSMQGYISSDNPPPDTDTLVTLIETNEKLAGALDGYKKAVKAAKRRAEEEERRGTVMSGAAPAAGEVSPVSPLTPQTEQQRGLEDNNNAFRF